MQARWLVPLLLVALVVALVGPAGRGAAPAAAAAVVRSGPRPVLTFASRGAAVRRAQTLLNRHGYRVPVTGFYGLLTVRQVRRFQVAHGIRNTGQVGPLTWPKLLGRRSGPLARATPAVRVARPSRALASGSAAVVYLTFDDGPTPTWTPRVLDLLARYRARATFFVVGRSAATRPGLVRRAYAAGH